jgi:hypothetical protein
MHCGDDSIADEMLEHCIMKSQQKAHELGGRGLFAWKIFGTSFTCSCIAVLASQRTLWL